MSGNKHKHFKKTSPEQFELLKSEMVTHPAAALGYGASRDRSIVDEEWKDIMEKLNAIGPPYRTLPEWKKVWSDVRLRSKKRLSDDLRQREESESEDEVLVAPDFIKQEQSTAQRKQRHERENDKKLNTHEGSHKKKKTTAEQLKLLKNEMSTHPAAAQGYGAGIDRHIVDLEWREIVEKLNNLGEPYRSMPEWKKVWSDIRLRINKRHGGNLCHIRLREECGMENHTMDQLDNTSSMSASHTSYNDDYTEPHVSNEAVDVPEEWSEINLRSGKREINQKLEEESDDDLLMETLNNASSFYNPHTSYEENSSHRENIEEAHDNHHSVDDSRCKKRHTTRRQFQVLKQEMKSHKAAALGYIPGMDRFIVDAEWRDILVKLNAVGPPYKTLTEWKKVWSDARLRLKKRILSKDHHRRRRRYNESDSETDLAMANSLYDSSNDDNYHEPQIIHEPIDQVVVTEAQRQFQSQRSAIDRNPLEDNDFQDSKHGIYPENYRMHKIDDSQYAENSEHHHHHYTHNNLMQQTLRALQKQSEQHNKLLENLTQISSAISNLMERQVSILEKRHHIVENQRKGAEYHNLLQRRQALRKSRAKCKISEWF